jgi:peroxin-3
MIEFLKKRKKSIFWTVAGTCGIYLLGKFAQYKIEEYLENARLEKLTREELKKRFETTQTDSTLTTLSLLPAVSDFLFQSMNVENLTVQLKDIKDKKEKLIIWNKIKKYSFARAFTALYSAALISLLLRIQLNLLSRCAYIKKSISFDSEKYFLCISWYLLNRGIPALQQIIDSCVEEVGYSQNLSDPMSLNDSIAFLSKIKELINGRSRDRLCKFMLPPVGEESVAIASGLLMADISKHSPETPDGLLPDLYLDADCQELIALTREMIESHDCLKVFDSCIDICIEKIQEKLNENVFQSEKKTKPFATLLPEISRQANNIINSNPNDYIQSIAASPPLYAFSAMVFSLEKP